VRNYKKNQNADNFHIQFDFIKNWITVITFVSLCRGRQWWSMAV